MELLIKQRSGVEVRAYISFSWRGANFRISSTHSEIIISEIKKQRELLERYIGRHPEFASSLVPVPLLADSPEIARRMQSAADTVGVGPMAAVAGAIAQASAQAALRAGAPEALVDNGGDIYLASESKVIVALYTGHTRFSGRLAVEITPEEMPLSICSSSGRMGRSLSLGQCDLASVVSSDAALADAAATLASNLVSRESDIQAALGRIIKIPGIRGLLLVKGDKVGLAGDFPPLIEHSDSEGEIISKVSSGELLPWQSTKDGKLRGGSGKTGFSPPLRQ